MAKTTLRVENSRDMIEAIKRFPLFQGIEPEEIAGTIAFSEFAQLEQGDILLRPSEPNAQLFLLLEGKLSVHTQLDKNPVAILGAGDCLGEMSLFEGELPSAFVLSVGQSRILAIHKEIIWRLIDRSSVFAQNLLHLMLQRIRSGNQSLAEIEEKLQVQEVSTFLDPLTGIYNRRWLNTMFQRALERATRLGAQETGIFLLMIDIDHFKQYNDNHGHLAGDECLRSVASALRDNIRPTDMLARYGGEEFTVLIYSTGKYNCLAVAERLRVQVGRQEMTDRRGTLLPAVTISVGAAEFQLQDSLEDLIERADRCLYRAKEDGRNCVFMD